MLPCSVLTMSDTSKQLNHEVKQQEMKDAYDVK